MYNKKKREELFKCIIVFFLIAEGLKVFVEVSFIYQETILQQVGKIAGRVTTDLLGVIIVYWLMENIFYRRIKNKKAHIILVFSLLLFAGCLGSDFESDYRCIVDSKKAENYCALGEYEKGIKLLDGVIQENPECYEAYTERGVCRYDLGQNQKALSDFNQSLEINPNEHKAYIGLAWGHMDSENPDKAIYSLKKSIDIKPTAEGYFYLSIAYRQKKNVEKEFIFANKCIEFDPQNPLGYLARGLTYYEKEEYSKALDNFEVALEKEPTFEQALKNKCDILNELNQSEQDSRCNP